jgi:hypothetical protein
MLGALAALSVVASAFFLRFRRVAGDALFSYFSAAFLIMALNWLLLGIWGLDANSHPWVYLPRLLAYVLIVAGIVQKNRAASKQIDVTVSPIK